MPRTLKELHERVLELERENRNKAVAIWHLKEEKLEHGKKIEQLEEEKLELGKKMEQLKEEKLELGKKMEQLLRKQDQLPGKQDQEQILGKQDQEQVLGEQDQRDANLKIKKVTFSDEALCKEVELGDDSLFDGGADDAMKDTDADEVAEETVEIPGCAKSSGSATPRSIKANNLDSQMLSILHKEDLVGTENHGKPDHGNEREEQQSERVQEACGKQLFEHDEVQAMEQGAQQSTQEVCSSHEGEEDYIRCASGGSGGVSQEAANRNGFSNEEIFAEGRNIYFSKKVEVRLVKDWQTREPFAAKVEEVVCSRKAPSTGEKAVIVKERGHVREKRLASQGRPKEGTRLMVMWGGKFYSCSVVKARFSAVKVHYIGWGKQYDEWVPFPSFKVKMDQ